MTLTPEMLYSMTVMAVAKIGVEPFPKFNF
jgi:hypothetical protein